MTTMSLVVRALNEADHIGALLSAAQQQTRPPDEMVLVDSGSTDETVAIAERHGARIVHIAPEEFSFGRALNVGCRHATGDIIVFASAHVYPCDEKWLERLTHPFTDEEVALSYGGQTGDERTQFSEQRLLEQWFPSESDPDQRHPFCNNANCAVRASVWEELPYDEELTGLEDLDWAYRALRQGHRLAYVADARVVHVHEESFQQTINRYRREAIAHRRIFDEQSIGRLEAIWLFFAHVSRDYAAAARDGKLLQNLVAVPRFRCAQFWGTYQGFSQKGDVTTALKRRFYYPNGFARAARPRPRRGSRS